MISFLRAGPVLHKVIPGPPPVNMGKKINALTGELNQSELRAVNKSRGFVPLSGLHQNRP